jgi:copper chaperone
MTTTAYGVTGLTCQHCVSAVTAEVGAIPGVQQVAVDLVAGEESTLTITADVAITTDALVAALDEAGDYVLVGEPRR